MKEIDPDVIREYLKRNPISKHNTYTHVGEKFKCSGEKIRSLWRRMKKKGQVIVDEKEKLHFL